MAQQFLCVWLCNVSCHIEKYHPDRNGRLLSIQDLMKRQTHLFCMDAHLLKSNTVVVGVFCLSPPSTISFEKTGGSGRGIRNGCIYLRREQTPVMRGVRHMHGFISVVLCCFHFSLNRPNIFTKLKIYFGRK
jgi:hypothetical protein